MTSFMFKDRGDSSLRHLTRSGYRIATLPVVTNPEFKKRVEAWGRSRLKGARIHETLSWEHGLLWDESAFIRTNIVTFAGAHLDGVNLREVSLPGADLHEAKLRG